MHHIFSARAERGAPQGGTQRGRRVRTSSAQPFLTPPRAFAADGVYTGEWTTLAMCGFIRGMGEGDGCLDRLWTKCYDDAKAGGVDI